MHDCSVSVNVALWCIVLFLGTCIFHTCVQKWSLDFITDEGGHELFVHVLDIKAHKLHRISTAVEAHQSTTLYPVPLLVSEQNWW